MNTNLILSILMVAIFSILPVINSLGSIKANKELIKCYQKFLEKNPDLSDGTKETIELHKKFHKEEIKDFWLMIFCLLFLGGVFMFILSTIF